MKAICSSNWVETMTREQTLEVLQDLAWSHIKEAGPYRPILGDFLRRGDWVGLCDFELHYQYQDDVMHIKHARQALGFFQKLESLDLGIDKEKVAFKKFMEAEDLCRETNRRLISARCGRLESSSPFVHSVFHTAQRKIAKVLGAVPSFDQLDFGFGPGATTTTKSRTINWATKLRSRMECSSELVPILNILAQTAPHWFFLHAHACGLDLALTDVTVGRGKLQFVPKNAKTYRSIIVEPILNGFVQRGYGRYIRQRLKRVGVDLDDQSRNQLLAKAGSKAGSLATIDLSAASDTISRELVFELLPLDWATWLSSCRTSHISFRGVDFPRPLEKFSSMGNGFTFELESLIFWGLCAAVLEVQGLPLGWLAVYGDDIVIPVEACEGLDEVFQFAGFKVNAQKSFRDGPFRESCGRDFFLGTDVRPYYQKELLSGETLFTLHNFYMRDFDFARAKKVRGYIHPSLLIFGPDGYGDGHLIGSWNGKRKKRYTARGWEVVCFDTFQRNDRRLIRLPDTDWALPTYCIYMRQGAETSYDPLVVAGSYGFKRISVCTHRRGVFSSW